MPLSASSELARDTTGAANSLHFSCEVESGVTVHVALPVGKFPALQAAWPQVLAEVEKALAGAKADERARLAAHLDAVS